MDFIKVDSNNIETEHICCAITEKKGENCVLSKKAWLKERFNDGLTFIKADVRGKVFIEFIPAESAWCPIAADDYMFINCLWVSGQYKGQGISNQLLEKCIEAAKRKGKIGLVVLSAKKKMPFLSDPKYLKYKGFNVADTASPYYELLYLPFADKAKKPCFKDCAKNGRIEQKGIVLYYSNQCPFTEKHAHLIKAIADGRGADFTLIKYQTTEQAQEAPAPFTSYSLFYDGMFVTNEILSEKKFIDFLDKNGL